jgi:hypothetical protein
MAIRTVRTGLTWGITAAVRAGARLRGARLFHPHGVVFDATFAVTEPGRWGVPLLDRPGRRPALVRLSKGMSTPRGLPDVLGLAVRIHGAGGAGRPLDLALATTGRRVGLRHLPVPRRDFATIYTSVLPYQVGIHRRLLAVAPTDPTRRIPTELSTLPDALAAKPLTFRLMLATPTGPWQPAAELTVTQPRHDDPSFDVTAHALDEFHPRGWLHHLRGPTYRASQQARHAATGAT